MLKPALAFFMTLAVIFPPLVQSEATGPAEKALAALISAQGALQSARSRAAAGLELEDWETDEEFVARLEGIQTEATTAEQQAFESTALALNRGEYVATNGVSLTVKSQDAKTGKTILSVTSSDPALPFSAELGYTPKAGALKAWLAETKTGLRAQLTYRLWWFDTHEGRVAVTSVQVGPVGAQALTVLATLPVLKVWGFPWSDRTNLRPVPLIQTVLVKPATKPNELFRKTARGEVTQEYWMSKTLVTQQQYELVMGKNPSQESAGFWACFRPVEKVSFYETMEFCNRLSVMEGLDPVYSGSGEITGWRADESKNGWRVPTFVEYFWAARGGALSKLTSFIGSDDFQKVGWPESLVLDASYITPYPVANELGLYMASDLREWMATYVKNKWETLQGVGFFGSEDMGPGTWHSDIGLRLVRR